MRKFLLSLLFLPAMVWGQSLEILGFDSIVYGHPSTSMDIYGHAAVKNNSSSAIGVKVKRHVLDPNNALTASNAICWGFCFSTAVDVSPDAITIGAGQINFDDFNGHVYPPMDGVERSGQIMYTFFDELNPNDSVSITVTYVTTNFFSVSAFDQKEFNLYPNPTRNKIWIEGKNISGGNAKVVVNDVIGNTVLQKQINIAGGRDQIDLGALRSGYYFVSLYHNGVLISTKRVQKVQ
ncbi:MAG: T9SS C-terminal target domain-containing protein [Flavobacteriales bacterium]|nr:MAG: T9SS C-terminal target domain-containing protein [Flavobacteriales bacterium]